MLDEQAFSETLKLEDQDAEIEQMVNNLKAVENKKRSEEEEFKAQLLTEA